MLKNNSDAKLHVEIFRELVEEPIECILQVNYEFHHGYNKQDFNSPDHAENTGNTYMHYIGKKILKNKKKKERGRPRGPEYRVGCIYLPLFPRDTAAVHTQRPSKSSVRTDRTDSGWETITYLRGGTRWRGRAGVFTPSLSGRASHPHAAHGCLRRRDAGACALTPLPPPPPPPVLPPCSVCSALLCSPLLWCRWYWCCWWCWWCCYPLPKRAEGAVWHLWGRTGWVTYQLWCQAHMAGTSLARAITWEPVIDMRPHSQRLASPRGRGTRHLSPSWKRKWNKEWMAQKKNRTGFKQPVLASIFGKKWG